MTPRSPHARRTRIALAAAVVLALGAATVVVAQGVPGTPGKAEVTAAGKSWPHEAKDANGKSMGEMLAEIHEAALAAIQTTSDPAAKQSLAKVLRLSAVCLAYDGGVAATVPPPVPVPAHYLGDAMNPAHAGAKQKVIAAYGFAKPAPPATADWASCGNELDHGH